MIEEFARVTELVRASPGLTATEVRDALRRAGRVSITTADVLRTLASAPHVFLQPTGQDGWWPTPTPTPTSTPTAPARTVPSDSSNPVPPVPPAFPALYRWQTAALAAWRQANCRGVVEAVTGTGKTVVGLAAACAELAGGGQVVVLVPTRELLTQWLTVARAAVPPGTSIGLLGDGHSDSLGHHDLVIAVVNSARDGDLAPRRPGGLLIADECHRYASTENRRALVDAFPRRLGLSATFARLDDGHIDWLAPYFGDTCYRLGYEQARQDEVIAPFDVVLVRLDLSDEERAVYLEQTEIMRASYGELIDRYDLPTEPVGVFLSAVAALARSDEPGAVVARRYLAAMQERRRVLDEAGSKLELLHALAPAVAEAERTLVFTSSIAASERSADLLRSHGLNAASIHSDQVSAVRRARMELFRAGQLQALIAPQVLDEGIDVADADLAIVVGATRSRRQMVQRMGRIVRRKADGRRARFVIGYIRETIEDPVHGAHESFLDEIMTVARRVEIWAPNVDGWDRLVEMLSPWPNPTPPDLHSTRVW